MIGAYSGLRVSDYNRLTIDNIQNYEGARVLEVLCKKTKPRYRNDNEAL